MAERKAADLLDENVSDQEWRVQKLIGRELRKKREDMGMTISDLAANMGGVYSEELLSQYEDGGVPMEIGPFFDMVQALHGSIEDFAPGKLMTRRLTDNYMKLDEEDRDTLERIADKFVLARREQDDEN